MRRHRARGRSPCHIPTASLCDALREEVCRDLARGTEEESELERREICVVFSGPDDVDFARSDVDGRLDFEAERAPGRFAFVDEFCIFHIHRVKHDAAI